MNLYQINEEIEKCIDTETGEILDLEALDKLAMERDTKIENLACWYKNLMADAEALKAENALRKQEDVMAKLGTSINETKGYYHQF